MADSHRPLSPQRYEPYDEAHVVRVYVAPHLRHRYWLHGLLFVLTLLTTLTVGAKFQFNFLHHRPVIGLEDDAWPFPLPWILHHPSNLLLGIPFAASLMGILFAHEMGHYLYCKKYRAFATLPYFLPAPTLIGTLGAFIRIKSAIRTRPALFDIGIAGPIAGFVVAVPLLFFGLSISERAPSGKALGFPLIFTLAHKVCGPPVPLDQVRLSPIAVAAWFGMFATALNLLPGGQLDGGHIIASIWPKAHRWISILTIGCLLAMSWQVFAGWLLWAIFLTIAIRHPRVPNQPKLNPKRQWIALLGLCMLILTLAPRPFAGFSLSQMVQQFRHGG